MYPHNLSSDSLMSQCEESAWNLIVLAVSQTLDERTGDIFAMLEARSIHDQATALSLDGFMRSYIETVRDALLRRHSQLSPKKA
jgi:hypothetical protein